MNDGLILLDGRFFTADPVRPCAESVAVAGGRFVRVGHRDQVLAGAPEGARVVDLVGRLAIPGLYDTHVHLITAVQFTREHCELPQALAAPRTPDDYLTTIEACYRSGRGISDGWFFGGCWEFVEFVRAGAGLPTKEMLDDILGDTPAYLIDTSIHAAWVNSAALRIAGVDRDTPDPEYGTIVRDETTGEPTGCLLEYSAMSLVGRHLPRLTAARRLRYAERGIAELNSYGVVGFIEAATSEADLHAFRTLADAGRLNARVTTMNSVVLPGLAAEAPTGRDIRRLAETYACEGLQTFGAKIYVDGAPINDTVAMLGRREVFAKPYRWGDVNISPETLNRVVTDLDGQGLQVMMHCMGDRAVRISLDAVEAARTSNGLGGPTHIISHVLVVAPEDMGRFGRLGVGANIQPWLSTGAHVPSDRHEWPHKEFYSYRSLKRAGAQLSVGHDWPSGTSRYDPFATMPMLVTREDHRFPEAGAYRPDEALSVEDVITMMTINGARQQRVDDVGGSIEEGKSADLAVLDRDIFSCPPRDLAGTRVLATLFAGMPVHQTHDSPLLNEADVLATPAMWR